MPCGFAEHPFAEIIASVGRSGGSSYGVLRRMESISRPSETVQPTPAGPSQQPDVPARVPAETGPVPVEPSVPPASGHVYHALDLLLMRPFPDQGELIVLDVAAQPSVAYGRVVMYNTWPGRLPDEANSRGVRFSQMLRDGTCIFNVIESVPGNGVAVPQSAGSIAVEIQDGASVPDAARIWDVEPDGTEEVTMNDGTVLQLPKVRFWSYHVDR